MTRLSFDRIVCFVEPEINSFPVSRNFGLLRPQDLARRKNGARDILLMTLKHLIAKSEKKYVQA